MLITSINFSVSSLLQGLSQGVDWSARNVIIDPQFGLGIVAKLIGAFALLWAILETQRYPETKRLALRIILFGLLSNMFGPLGWAHYFLLQLLLLPALFSMMPRSSALATVFGFGLATSWMALTLMRSWLPGDLPVALIFTTVFVVLFLTVLRKARP